MGGGHVCCELRDPSSILHDCVPRSPLTLDFLTRAEMAPANHPPKNSNSPRSRESSSTALSQRSHPPDCMIPRTKPQQQHQPPRRSLHRRRKRLRRSRSRMRLLTSLPKPNLLLPLLITTRRKRISRVARVDCLRSVSSCSLAIA